MKKASIPIFFLIVFSLLPVKAAGQKINDSNIYINVYPDTCNGQPVYIDFISKKYGGLIDFALGFTGPEALPTSLEIFKPHNFTRVFKRTIEDRYFTDPAYKVNYTYSSADPSWIYDGELWLWDPDEESPENLANTWHVDFDRVNRNNYTVFSSQTEIREWKQLKKNSLNWNKIYYKYDDAEIWFLAREINIEKNKLYRLRLNFDVKPSLKGKVNKYYVALKPSNEYLFEAVEKGHFYILDPWFNTSWPYRKQITIQQTAGADVNYTIKFKFHYGSGSDSGNEIYLNSHSRSDFQDLRFTDLSNNSLSYWPQNYYPSLNSTFWVRIEDNLTTANAGIYVYYGNLNATTTGSGPNTFRFFDDMEGTNGNTPTSYTDASSANCEFVISDTVSYDQTQAARSQDNNNNGWSTGHRDIAASFEAIHYFTYNPQTTQPNMLYMYADAGRTNVIVLATFDTDGTIDAWDGAAQTYLMDYVVDTWYEVEVRFNYSADTYDLLINETIEANDFDFFNSASYSQAIGISFISGKTYQSTDYWYRDAVFSRFYVEPEPQVLTVGNEETQTTPGAATAVIQLDHIYWFMLALWLGIMCMGYGFRQKGIAMIGSIYGLIFAVLFLNQSSLISLSLIGLNLYVLYDTLF